MFVFYIEIFCDIFNRLTVRDAVEMWNTVFHIKKQENLKEKRKENKSRDIIQKYSSLRTLKNFRIWIHRTVSYANAGCKFKYKEVYLCSISVENWNIKHLCK